MAETGDLERVIEDERALVFDRFDEETAFRLGCAMRDKALADGLPIVIDIRTWDRMLFFAALPGSNGSNENWVRRKVNTVRLTGRSTWRMVLEQTGRADRNFAPDHGLDPKDYVLAGGAFPVRLQAGPVVGAVTISGLPQRDDHLFVVGAIAAHLGKALRETAGA